MTESAPRTTSPQGEQGVGRREFLKGVGRLTTAVAAGVIGGVAVTEVKRVLDTTETLIPLDPAQEWIEVKFEAYRTAVESGDAETIKIGTELAELYEEELVRNLKACTALQIFITKSKPDAKRAVMELELYFLTERQRWLSEHINLLKDPVHHFLQNFLQNRGRGPEGPEERENPDNVPQPQTSPISPLKKESSI